MVGVFGMLNIAHAVTNPVQGENLFAMFGIACIAWAATIYKVTTKN